MTVDFKADPAFEAVRNPLGRWREEHAHDPPLHSGHDMLAELREDNLTLVSLMKETHALCDEHGDIATASLIENWVDEAERRAWFLFETARGAK